MRGVLFVFLLVVFGSFASAYISGDVVQTNVHSGVSIGGIIVLASTFDGATTTFTGKTTVQFQNLSNVTLEKLSKGKIVFNEPLNFSLLANSSRVVDFDHHLTISSNYIFVNNSALNEGINKKATIHLYNLNFVNIEIMREGIVCSDCVLNSYIWGILIFNVSNFSSYYSVREGVSPTPTPTPQTPGGGGGAPQAERIYGFSLDKDFFPIQIKKGDSLQKQVRITNNGTEDLTINISISESLSKFIIPETDKIILRKGESKNVRFDFYVSDSDSADVYIGKINFNSEKVSQSINVALDVKDKNPLFDIKTKVKNKVVSPGDRIVAEIEMINMGDLNNIDVKLNYYIFDFNDKVYDSKEESLAINHTLKKDFYLQVPEDMNDGDYLFYSKVSYGNITASSYDSFNVQKYYRAKNYAMIFASVIAAGLILLMFLRALFKKNRKKSRRKKRVSRIVQGYSSDQPSYQEAE